LVNNLFQPQLQPMPVKEHNRIDKDVKLALMIAQKYLKYLPMSAMDQFERSGDRKEFEEAVKRLNL